MRLTFTCRSVAGGTCSRISGANPSSGLKRQLLGASFFELVFRARKRNRFDVVPQRREVPLVARKDVARFAGRDHKAGFVRVGQIVKSAKTAPMGSGKWQIRDNLGAATSIKRVEAPA